MSAIKEVGEGNEQPSYELFDEISVRFMRAVKATYGSEKAVDVMNNLQETLGKDWTGRVVFNMMADNHKYLEDFTLHCPYPHSAAIKKINAIKCIRALTGMGLGDSKEFVERAMVGEPQRGSINMSNYSDDRAKERQVREWVNELNSCGFKVEIM